MFKASDAVKRAPWGDIVRYTAFLGIAPRIKAVLSSGFQYVAFFMALVYQAVRLLPAGHPYANAQNMGRFGVRHVIAEAANHLVLDIKNIDQILVFMMILIGVVIGFIQMVTFAMSLFMAPVLANDIGLANGFPTGFFNFFTTQNPEQDIAHMLLDLVFGIPDLFGSCIGTDKACIYSESSQNYGNLVNADERPEFAGGIGNLQSELPFPIHNGLHQMLQIYSVGLLVIAVLITLYFVLTVIAETAQTGTAFGRRFNRVWAPIRLVAAFGLLIPIGAHGLNSAQYLVLYAAKFGSGFATNAWVGFNRVLNDQYIAQIELIAQPNIPEIGAVLQHIYVARTCKEYYELTTTSGGSGGGAGAVAQIDIQPYLVKNPISPMPSMLVSSGTDYNAALNFSEDQKILSLRFGRESQTDYGLYRGFVKPLCGELTFTVNDGRSFSVLSASTTLERAYWRSVLEVWEDQRVIDFARSTAQCISGDSPAACDNLPDETFASQLVEQHNTRISIALSGDSSETPETAITGAIAEAQASATFDVQDELIRRGWGGAAIWYNRVAEMNGAVTTAVFNVPQPRTYPDVLEKVRAIKKESDENVPNADRFDPVLAAGRNILLPKPEDAQLASILNTAYKFWQDTGFGADAQTLPTGNAILDVINAIFGTRGLIDIRGQNANIHPLAQLSAIGRSLIESAVRNLGIATAGGVGGILSTVFDSSGSIAELVSVVSGFLITIGIITLTIGWVLFYVVPFLPFIYFFFAVVGWVKGIFEAMVGAPLWALAHIRIDQEGLPGRAGEAGYYLLFEIFLRPILILSGLLASITIFAAMVQLLNESFDLVTANLTGFNQTGSGKSNTVIDIEFYRSPLDQFMFTVIYAIIVYLLGVSSFKLIDQIPNQILRWMGQSVNAFNDSREDPGQKLISSSFIGGQQTFQALGGGLSSLGGSARGAGARNG